MRVELTLDAADSLPAPAPTKAPRRRLDPFEIGLLVVFAALSMWVVALDLWQVVAHGWVWTGTDGFFIVDQMQYLAWIQSASHHLLAANLFVLRPTPNDYLQPAVAISGAVAALGVAPWLALLLWKPIAVLGTFLAIRAYCYRTLEGRYARRAGLTLGLLFGSFSVVYGTFGIVGDMMPDWLSWGYPFGLMAVALIVFALLGYDRARSAGEVVWIPGLFGALASALHPWQGELMILVIAAAELIRWREHRTLSSLRLPLLTLLLTGLPLLYYLVLGHADLSWDLARQASKHEFSFWSIALGIAPLAIVALLGYRGRPRDFLELMSRLWPLAAVAIYFMSATALSATPLHAFDGLTIPLAMLAVAGVQRVRLTEFPRARLAGVVAIALGTIPANAYALAVAHQYTDPTPGNANFITRDERDALAYLERNPIPGGVLTQFYLGEAVPGRTGRHTFVGDCLWSEPHCIPRSLAADALFDGSLSPGAARRFVRDSGARFLLFSCAAHTDLQSELRPLIASIKRFGCATVYELRGATAARGALAESPTDAAVRAPRRQ
ncbi:MAG TPA: hypothetical protein VGH45_02640 [Solirubrobacteraceae bacterium]